MTIRLLTIAGFIILSFSFPILSQELPKYSKVKVYTNSLPGGLKALGALGVTTDHGEVKKDVYFISDFSEHEINLIQQSGFQYEINIDDVVEFYISQNTLDLSSDSRDSRNSCNTPVVYPSPQNFQLGSMGGFFTFQEMINNLDSMASKYPSLISVKQSIGNSVEGRPIYHVKISDNPSVDQNKPEVFYNALHHAREPASLSQLIYYMWYLLENYDTNAEVKYLVDNLEMFFVPCVNPDGYVYNYTTNPNGGGMWRKNRKNNGDGTFGVDLNRNYGYSWGFDNSGSSPSSGSDVYRGPAAFSEPETQAVRDFCNQRDFKLTLNYHTYGNLLIYPWGFQPSYYTPDSALFVNYAQLLTRDNNYKYGTGDQTVNYVVNGSSDDWMYGEETTKNKTMAMTPEAGEGSDGFWPPSSRIKDICMVNIRQNLSMAHLAGKFALAKDKSPAMLAVKNAYIDFEIVRLGLDPANFTVSIIPLNNVSSAAAPKVFSGLDLLESKIDSISIALNPAINDGQAFSFVLAVNNGMYTHYDTITKIYGLPVVLLADNGNNLGNWQTSTWGITSNAYYSPSSSITDSPNGNYANNINKTITSLSKINLVDATSAMLTFMAKWDIEAGYDYVQVMASLNGSSWTPLCGKYTKPGSSNQVSGEPLYDGLQTTWVKEEINLSDYLGQEIFLRYKIVSDNYETGDGFYFDDLIVTTTGSLSTLTSQHHFTYLFQNQPNPANDYTYINFNVLTQNTNNKIILYNSLGSVITEIPVYEQQGSIRVNTSELATGIYYYTIESGENKTAFKKMVIVR
ncbi:MAG: immune inhibitor A [Bacteroidetes bacterium]|nr:immune inhibitor A [Bacteroidota bacterium]HET6244187.1 M14 family zinc carboxypeptidase [Bacteroidia bacterium]